MNKSFITAAAIATLTISSTSAFATATAGAQLTSLTVTLSQIKASGPAASATFAVGSGDEFYTYAYTYDPFTYQYVVTYGSGAFGEGGQSVSTPHAGGAGALTGDVYSDDGAVVATSASASGTPGSVSLNSAIGEVLFGNAGGSTTFTLGKNTRLDISADYSITGSASGAVATGYEYAAAGVSLSLTGVNGPNSQTSIAGASNYASSYFGSQYSPSFAQTGELDVTFTGSKNAMTSGTFSGYVYSYAYSNVSSVPEPANAAFLLGGLSAIGLLARRRSN